MISLGMLSYAVLLMAVVLMTLKLWSWFDTQKDWKAVQALKLRTDSSVYQQAFGFRRLADIRVLDGMCWLGVAVLSYLNRNLPAAPTPYPPATGRVILLILIVLEIMKLANDRYTRANVSTAVRREKWQASKKSSTA